MKGDWRWIEFLSWVIYDANGYQYISPVCLLRNWEGSEKEDVERPRNIKETNSHKAVRWQNQLQKIPRMLRCIYLFIYRPVAINIPAIHYTTGINKPVNRVCSSLPGEWSGKAIIRVHKSICKRFVEDCKLLSITKDSEN